ncbi:MAG: tetratricopeptide repeat protein [Alphaproteobacteria bacterium]|nr:tetratricopeptide repeat protein [Alphaproteobacteria bacterium]
MSDQNNHNDQEEFEAMFSSEEGRRDKTPVQKKQDGDFPEEILDADVFDADTVSGEDLADFSDIDDGVDENGIFAASSGKRKKRKKSSSPAMMALVVLLAVGGAGGYFYYTNPEIINQIKENFAGEVASSSLLSGLNVLDGDSKDASGSQSDGGTQDVDSVIGGIIAPSVDEMPPQPEPVEMTDAAGTITENVSGVSEDMPVPDNVVLSPDAPLVDSGSVAQSLEGDMPSPPMTPDTPVEEVTQNSGSVVPVPENEQVAENEVTPDSEPVVRGGAKIIRPTEKVKHKITLVDDLSPEDKPNVSELQSVPVVKADAQSVKDQVADTTAEADKKDMFFDAPSGKILATLPAPSLDAKRGKYESIIVVNSPTKSSSKSSKKAAADNRLDIQTTTLDDRVVAASRALKLGRYDAAKNMYDELYTLNPRDPRVLMGRAILLQKIGEPDRAIAAYEEVLAVAPDNAEAIVNMAGLIRKVQPAMALSKLLDMRQKYPDNAAIAAQLGVAYADSGNLQDAYRYLDLATSMQPGNAQHYFNMAIIAERARDIPKAIGMYEKALEVDAIHGGGATINRDVIYDRLTRLR